MPEALEKWSVELIGKLLPRHLEIIFIINHVFMSQIEMRYSESPVLLDLMKDMSMIEESEPKMVRMANLSVISSHAVNGVAALHTNLLANRLFASFNEYFPKKIQNKTNGVTPRR